MNNDRISIIVPVYNAEATLPKTLDSLIASTHKNIEIILVDDGSADESAEICEQYASRDTRVVVIRKPNGGVSSARNAGINAATGDWLAFCDADDKVESDMYSYLLEKAKKYGVKTAQCAIYFDDESGSTVTSCPPRDTLLRVGSHSFHKDFIKFLNYGCCCKIYARSILPPRLFDERLRIGEDLRFNLDVLLCCEQMLLCSEPKYHYIQRSTSAMHSPSSNSQLNETVFLAMSELSNDASFNKVLLDISLLNSADRASKAVIYGRVNADTELCMIRKDVKKNLGHLIFSSKLSLKNKLKLLLISHFPRAYKTLLRKVKSAGT